MTKEEIREGIEAMSNAEKWRFLLDCYDHDKEFRKRVKDFMEANIEPLIGEK